MRRNVYLGKKVRDVRKKGLDTISEVKGIRDAIIEDRRKGRIDARTASSRMNLLKLVVSRDSDFQVAKKKRKALSIVDKGIQKLKNMNRKSSRRGRKSRGRR